MTVINDLLTVPERENGGRTAYDRFDFQTAWGVSKVLNLHLAGADYAVGFEFHNDIAELNDAHVPASAVFYQMKSLDTVTLRPAIFEWDSGESNPSHGDNESTETAEKSCDDDNP